MDKVSALTEVTISLLQWGIDRFAEQTRSASPRLGQKVARFTATDEVLHVYCAKQILSRYVRTQTRTITSTTLSRRRRPRSLARIGQFPRGLP